MSYFRSRSVRPGIFDSYLEGLFCIADICNTMAFLRHELFNGYGGARRAGGFSTDLFMNFVVSKRDAILLVLCACVAGAFVPALGLEPARSLVLSVDPAKSGLIANFAEVMCDARGDIPLDAAQSGNYRPLADEVPTSGNCRGYWIRFNLHADATPGLGWVLQVSRSWSFVDLYYSKSSETLVERTGSEVPPQLRALPSGDMALPIALDDRSDHVFYLHLVGNTSRFGESSSLGATIQPVQLWTLQQRSALFSQGIYAGIILGLVLYNLILYISIRERAYLFYVLYVTSFGCLWIARTGFLYEYLWPNHPSWDRDYQPYLAASAIFFSILFVREFLSTRVHSRKLDLMLLAIAALTVLFCLASFARAPFSLLLVLALTGLAITVFYTVIGLDALVRGYRPARFFLVAWTALLAGCVIYIFMFLRALPTNVFTYNAAQAGSALECILLAFALADRVNLLKREKDQKRSEYTRDLQEQVQQRTAELSDAVEKLQTASLTDPLTGLSNRRHVEAAIQPWLAELQRQRLRNAPGSQLRSLALCLADLDHFKRINDDLGHAVGDMVLLEAANTLRHCVRATAILARWGGEEFLILDHVAEPREDLLMAERLRCSLLENCPPIAVEMGRSLSLSLGVVRYPFSEAFPDLLDWDQSLALADHALYRAKKAGRNRWQCYRPNEPALRDAIQSRGEDGVRRLFRLQMDQALTLGLIDVVEQIPTDVEVS
jgi:diguanylate cyclase (GGDEF)-like protein